MWKLNSPKYKLRKRMIITNVVLAILPLVIFGIFSYHIFVNNSNKVMTDTIHLMFDQMNSRLNEYFDGLKTTVEIFLFDEDLRQRLISDPDVTSEETYDEISKQLNSLLLINSTIVDAMVYTKSGVCISVNQKDDDFNVAELISAVNDQDDKMAFVAVPGEANQNVIAAIRSIHALPAQKATGYGIVLIDKSKLTEMIEQNIYDSRLEIMILDKAGSPIILPRSNVKVPVNLIRQTEQQNIDTFTFEKKTYRFSRYTSEQTGWEMIAVVSEEELYKGIKFLTYSVVFYIIVSLFFVIVITSITNFRITRPITLLSEAIDRVASGDLKHKISFSDKNEITMIADNFNNMVDEMQALTKKIFLTQQQLYESELEKKMFEVSSLQSQINSHFLYNTLSCIRGMSKMGATDQVSNMITYLVNMLRYATELVEKVKVKDEFNNIYNYMQIQIMRLGEQLELTFDTKDDILDCEMPKMILQPVVENAILHAFGTKKGSWKIRIRSEASEDRISIIVMDNGQGIPKQQLEALNLSLKNKKTIMDTTETRTSIGLTNIQNRIRALYGDGFGICVKSWVGLGTAVVIEIPNKRSDDFV